MCSGSSVTLTSKRDWMDSRTSWSASEEMKVMARPLVPKRPARLRTMLVHESRVDRDHKDEPDTMEVAVGIAGSIVVDNNVDTLDIDTTTEDISRYKDTLLKCLEGGVSLDAAK